MNQSVPFIKYSSYGNSFIIIDEVKTRQVKESEKAAFSAQAANIFFGIGSDGVIFLQPNTKEIFKEINHAFRYWQEIPDISGDGFVLRLFEPDGSESFNCGNGLLSIADYVFHQYGLDTADIMTEVPTGYPQKLSVGTNMQQRRTSWVNMGQPGRIPYGMVCPDIISRFDDSMDRISRLSISNPGSSLKNEPASPILISGYLIYTGEPHFVIFTEKDVSVSESMFVSNGRYTLNHDIRSHISSRYIRLIGRYLNSNCPGFFPKGINIDFVRINQSDSIEYRCFERGVNRETLSCGTGSVACFAVARKLNLIQSDQITILPHLCGLFNPESRYIAQKTENKYFLYGAPQVVCKGNFNYEC